MQAMWLLIAVASLTHLQAASRVAGTEREFPMLTAVIYDICGLSDVDITEAKPCPWFIYGFAHGFSECAVQHSEADDEGKGFKSCVLGCSETSQCSTACASNTKPDAATCTKRCEVMMGCVLEAVNTTSGEVSAGEQARICFMGKQEEYAKQTESNNEDNEDSPATDKEAFLAMKTRYAGHASPAPATEMQDARVLQELALDKSCRCDMTGLVNGVTTGRQGCARYREEPEAGTEEYCYVTGDMSCGGAMPSVKFPGIYWVSCERPDWRTIFPPQCELISAGLVKIFPVPSTLALQAPPSTYATPPPWALQPMNSTPMDRLAGYLESWKQPMPSTWHAERFHIFRPNAAPAPVAAPSPASLPTFQGDAVEAAAAAAGERAIWQAMLPAPAPSSASSPAPSPTVPGGMTLMEVGESKSRTSRRGHLRKPSGRRTLQS